MPTETSTHRPFSTSASNIMSSSVYQYLRYVNRLFQQQQSSRGPSKAQPILPIARAPIDIQYERLYLPYRFGLFLHDQQLGLPCQNIQERIVPAAGSAPHCSDTVSSSRDLPALHSQLHSRQHPCLRGAGAILGPPLLYTYIHTYIHASGQTWAAGGSCRAFMGKQFATISEDPHHWNKCRTKHFQDHLNYSKVVYFGMRELRFCTRFYALRDEYVSVVFSISSINFPKPTAVY
jgi:hypothetical protein